MKLEDSVDFYVSKCTLILAFIFLSTEQKPTGHHDSRIFRMRNERQLKLKITLDCDKRVCPLKPGIDFSLAMKKC